jgi:hypothetical protein
MEDKSGKYFRAISVRRKEAEESVKTRIHLIDIEDQRVAN